MHHKKLKIFTRVPSKLKMTSFTTPFLLASLLTSSLTAQAQGPDDIISVSAAVEKKVIEWRRQIHQNPELSNREVETAKLVADHLRSLGIEVQTNVGVHGVVGVLRGANLVIR